MYVGVYSETRIDKVWFYIIIIYCVWRRETHTNPVPQDIPRVSFCIPCDFTVWTPSWTGWHIWPRLMAHWTSISCDRILGHGNGSVLTVDLIAVIIDYSSLPIPIKHLNPFRPRWEGGGGVIGLMSARYVPLASQSPYPIIVYFLANYRPHLSHFLENVIFAIPT